MLFSKHENKIVAPENALPTTFSLADIQRLERRVERYHDIHGDDATDVRAFLGQGGGGMATMLGLGHESMAHGKGQDMDAKLPGVPEDVARAQLDGMPVQGGTSLTGAGEKSALANASLTSRTAVILCVPSVNR